ncbi:MAG TPA: fumarate hydratase [Methanothermococcus okinawensis]|uniref:Fumarate hydratase n=1 Tax=Methanothermococcus okinawensis TaxID=155863 RepID=A0A832ZCQ0_9EURY|nr:fumarate hydratase [Methanococcaceae archaeon]HIP84093.1 fumarate hydratase [Methanothermococcus okinawensis]HIP91639.1 fumarate hydratase [Methanothermococcus okinawensis]
MNVDDIAEVVVDLFRETVTTVPEDVERALLSALEREESEISRSILKAILKNIEVAQDRSIPLCQDTGVPIVFLKVGRDVSSTEILHILEGIKKGVARATEEIPLRPNVVNPFTRENLKTNVGLGSPFVDVEIDESLEREVEIKILPKGAGSENMGALKMLTPAEGIEGIRRFVLETVAKAGGKPCPPIILGVGVGGTGDTALKLAKKALLRRIGERHPNRDVAKLERELLDDINKLGIGAMGLGGSVTALDVFIEYMGCHTASLPVGICIQCWAHRWGRRVLKI